MKDMIISAVLTAVAILFFSVSCFPADLPGQPAGIGTQYQSDSGRVVPGSGSEPAEAQETFSVDSTETTPEADVVRLGTAKAECEPTEPMETEPERITKNDFWAAVWVGAGLFGIGQLVALLIYAVFKCGR